MSNDWKDLDAPSLRKAIRAAKLVTVYAPAFDATVKISKAEALACAQGGKDKDNKWSVLFCEDGEIQIERCTD